MLNKSVLLVDYEPKGLASMMAYLEGLGLTVETATDGSMALSKFFDKRPDLVVMSPMLPKIHGFDVCRQITQSPEGKEIPVVIVTAVYKGSKYKNEAIHSCGARAYFEKPYQEEELTETIFRLLGVKREKPQPPGRAQPEVAKGKTLEDILPSDFKESRTMPFIKKADVLASLQLGKEKPQPKPTRKASEKSLTSEDIFGDVIESVEVGARAPVPAAGPGAPASERPRAEAAPPEVPPPAAARLETQPREVETPSPTVAPPQVKAEQTVRLDRLESIEEFGKLDRTVKKQSPPPPAWKMDHTDPEIEKKLEQTLSGLSLDRPRQKAPTRVAAAPPPAAAPTPVAAPSPKVEARAPTAPAVAAEVSPAPPPTAPAPAPVAEAPAPVKAEAPRVEPKVERPAPEMKPAPVEPKPAPVLEKPAPAAEKPALEPKPPAAPERPRREERGWPLSFGDYVLMEKIATGGMAELFKAKRSGPEGFEKILAIKRILPHLSDNEEFVTMFIDEAKVAAQLNHPNIVHIYDLGRIEDSFFIAMEYVLGRDLRGIIKDLDRRNHTIPYELAAYMGIKVCEALDYAHRKLDYNQRPLNIVHRDVSPQNVLISYEGEVKLVDFGVAKAASKAHHTTHGALKGKILYMSPEQAWGRSLDHRSDLFSLGSVLFEMTTGRKLFLGDSEISTLEAVRNGKVMPPSTIKSDFPKSLEETILKALRLKPEDRFSSAAEMQKALEHYLDTLHLRPSPSDLCEFMYGLYAAEMKAKGIQFEPRKAPAQPAAPKPPEPTIRVERPVEKPEVKVPPPKVIAVEKPAAPAAAPAVSAPAAAPVTPAASARAHEPEVAFKGVLDTAVHTGYQKVRRQRMGIIGAIVGVVLIAAGVFYYLQRSSGTPQTSATTPSTVPAPSVTTPPATGPIPPAETTTPATGPAQPPAAVTTAQPLSPEEQAKRLEEQRKREEERLKALEEKKKQDEAARAEAQKAADEQAKQAELERQRLAAEEQKKKEEETAAQAAAETERLRKEEEARRQAEAQKPPQAQQVNEGDLVPITQVDSAPTPLNRPMPVYPDMARRQGVSGTVKLSILVSEAGSVIDVKVLSEQSGKMGILNESATTAVRRWKYQPAVKSGKRVKVWLNVNIPFVR